MKLLYEESGELVEFPIDDGEVVIGRKSYCDLCFPDTSVSKKHARIVRDGEHVELQDAGSRNGTVLNGEIIDGPTKLRPGDKIQIGKIKLRVQEGAAAASAKRSAPSNQVRFDDEDDDLDDLDTDEKSAGAIEPAPAEAAGAEADEPLPPPQLVVVAGNSDRTWDLTRPHVTIGSKPANDIQLDAEGVSRFHAELRHDETAGVWLVKDLGSRNGVYVDGVKVEGEGPVKSGREIQIGAARLRLVIPSNRKPLPTDLKGLLADERVRKALAGVIVLLVAIALLAPSGARRIGATGVSGYDANLLLGFEAFEQGAFEQARNIFDELKMAEPERQAARSLYELNELWERREKKFSFEWDKAAEKLAEITKNERMPGKILKWARAEQSAVERDARARKIYLAADQTVRQSDERAKRNPDVARLGYIEALERFEREVPPDSVFRPESDRKAKDLRARIMKSFEDSIQRLYAEEAPPWPDIRDLIDAAKPYAGRDKKRLLDELADQVTEELAAEGVYNDAYDIIELRQVERYGEAKGLLRRIPNDTRLYEQAQALVQWIDAELLSIDAFAAYDGGDALKAIRLIDEILTVPILAPDVRDFVAKKKRDIGFVFQRFEQGIAAFKREDNYTALAAFNDVLRTEKRPENQYNQRATKYYETIKQSIMAEVRGHLIRGTEALKTENYEFALREYGLAVKSSNGDRGVRERITQEIDRRAPAMMRTIKDVIHKNQKLQYPRCKGMCDLILEYASKDSAPYREAQEKIRELSRR